MKTFSILIFVLYLVGIVLGNRFEEAESTNICPPCSTRTQSSASYDDSLVRKLLAMNEQMTKDIQYLHESVTSLNNKYERYDESRTAALDKEIMRLKDEIHALKSKTRDARTQTSNECTSKIVEVAVEAKREIARIQENSDICFKELELLRNNSRDSQTLALKTENEELKIKLEDIQKRVESECQESTTDHTLLERGGRSTLEWHRPKPTLGKEASTVTKIPSNNYKHSCKGFLASTPAAEPSHTEINVRIGNIQYLVGEQEMTWAQAWRLCKARGMWILSLESAQEQLELEPHLSRIFTTPIKYWLFARKADGSEWFNWECASSGESEPWKLPYNPDAYNKSSVRCATLDMHSRYKISFGDDACDLRNRYICRKLVPEC